MKVWRSASAFGDDADRDPEAGAPLEGWHQRRLAHRSARREPAHPLLVEQVEVGRVTERPARPDDLVQRAALVLEPGLQIGEAAACVLLDPTGDETPAVRVDRPDGRDIDHAPGLDGLAQSHLDDRLVVDRVLVLDAEPALLRPDRLLRILGRDAELALGQGDAVAGE